MKKLKKLTALLIVFSMLVPMMFIASAGDDSGIVYKRAVKDNADGTYNVSLEAYQSGELMPLDIVMVLDVSGSMEYNVAVKTKDIDPTEDYYIEFVWKDTNNGGALIGKKYKVTNTAQSGEEPLWVTDIEGERVVATPIEPGTVAKEKGEYVFYTGAIDDLKAAATGFVRDIAKSAQENGLSHNIAVVEFSSSQKKGEHSLNTHEHSFYANILSGDGSPENALVSATEKTDELEEIFSSLKAEGPTYSDDALMQAKKIFEKNESEDRRRAVVLFTDGGPGSYGWSSKTVDLDNSSIPTANAAISCANEMKSKLSAEIYTIGFFDANELDAVVDQKNKKYLAYVSSNHNGENGMSDTTTPVLGGYCYINTSDADINAVFKKISTALGEGLDNVEIRDTVSEYFYMTAEQKKVLTDAVPDAVITEYRDGTTRISVPDAKLTQIIVDENGHPVDSDDEGIFRLNYSVTRRKNFIGGKSVPVNTDDSGVFNENGKKLSVASVSSVDVSISEELLGDLIEIKTPSVLEGQQLSAKDFYEDKSADWFAGFVKVSYKVTDENGDVFTSATVTPDDDSKEFTVTATVTSGEEVYTISKKTVLSVEPDTVTGYEITKNIDKTEYFVGDTLVTDGFELCEVYKSGKKVPVDGEIVFSPISLETAGTQKITAFYNGESFCFDVTVKEVKAQTVELLSQPEKTEYFVGDTFLPDGISLKVINNNGTEKTVTEGYEYTQTQFTVAGRHKITVTYEEKSVSFYVDVSAVKAIGAKVLTLPDKTSFVYKQSPDFTGLSVEITYNNGDTKIVTAKRDMTIKRLTDEKTRRGEIMFSVTVEGQSDTFALESTLVWWQWILLILLLGFIWY